MNNEVYAYIEESIREGVSKFSLEYSMTRTVKTYILYAFQKKQFMYNYYNIPQTMSKECFEIIHDKFNDAEITSFLEAIMFVEEVISPYILMEKMVG